MQNTDIADAFERVADLLEVTGGNEFRIRAYRNAAQTIVSLPEPVPEMVNHGEDLTELPGIGKDLAGKIETMVQTGSLPILTETAQKLPSGIGGLMKVTGLGGKRVKKIYEALGVKDLDELKQAAIHHRIREIEGFGKKTEDNILDGIRRLEGKQKRKRIDEAEKIAVPVIEHLKPIPGVHRIIIAGSFRRRKDTVRDLDVLVTCADPEKVMNHFVLYKDIAKVVAKGETRSTVLLHNGMQVDIRVVGDECFGAALFYFTGSKAHNIAVRKRGIERGLKINEYGVFRNKQRIAGRTEEELYRAVGLPLIDPELRENRGEIEAAEQGALPVLVNLSDIRGDLHTHTERTDGHATAEAMAMTAIDRGYEYIAVTDHTKRTRVAHGQNADELQQELDEIDRINEQLEGITILKGAEIDILSDGSLDLPDSVLKQLDIRVCSVHYNFDLSREQQTRRILRAMDNPYFNILAHPSGRLLNKRDPYDVDMERVIDAAKERGCFLELNAHPQRLDLTDIQCRMAKERGVKLAISTDAHFTKDFSYIHYGIGQARRGWIESGDVINTLPLNELRKLLKRP